MRTFRVKAFLWIEAENETDAEELAAEMLLSVSKNRGTVRVRERSAKLVIEKKEKVS